MLTFFSLSVKRDRKGEYWALDSTSISSYPRQLAGNIPDVKTVQPYVDELETLGVKGVKLLMDRGFYSGENLDTLFTSHYKFLTACTISLKFVKDGIARHRNDMRW